MLGQEALLAHMLLVLEAKQRRPPLALAQTHRAARRHAPGVLLLRKVKRRPT